MLKAGKNKRFIMNCEGRQYELSEMLSCTKMRDDYRVCKKMDNWCKYADTLKTYHVTLDSSTKD